VLDVVPFLVIAMAVYVHFSMRKSRDMFPVKRVPQRATADMAFATLTSPAFCMGAVQIGYSLRKYHGSKYDLICLVTPDVNQTWIDILSQWWRVIRVPNYKPFPGFRRSWAKLHLWNRVEYRKLVYLDTDMLVLGPLDELFDYPMLSCVPDPLPPQICNTGVLVIEPKPGLMDRMKTTVKEKELFLGVGDQSFINSFFANFTPIKPIYNSPRTSSPGIGQYLQKNMTRIVHMVCKKPWKCGREGVSYCGCGYPKLNSVWWELWDEACKDHLCMETWKEGS
jgi:glycogenin glucosyltransferase